MNILKVCCGILPVIVSMPVCWSLIFPATSCRTHVANSHSIHFLTRIRPHLNGRRPLQFPYLLIEKYSKIENQGVDRDNTEVIDDVAIVASGDAQASEDASVGTVPSSSAASLLGCIALVAGTTVGAGVLALPAKSLWRGSLPRLYC